MTEQRAEEIAAFVAAHGRCPRSVGRDLLSGEAVLGSSLYFMRKLGRWDLLDPRGIPRAADPRAEAARKAAARRTPEQRSDAARRAAAAQTPERRSEVARRRDAQLTPEARRGRALRAAAARLQGKTPEQRSEAARGIRGRPQFASLADLIPRLCRCWRPTTRTPSVEGDTGWALNSALRKAADPEGREASRGLGRGDGTPEGRARAAEMLAQVSTLRRACREVEADCWRLTLRGEAAPDPRPWAEILAAGDAGRVERAERVASLDWTGGGAPVRRSWPPSAASC